MKTPPTVPPAADTDTSRPKPPVGAQNILQGKIYVQEKKKKKNKLTQAVVSLRESPNQRRAPSKLAGRNERVEETIYIPDFLRP